LFCLLLVVAALRSLSAVGPYGAAEMWL